MRENKRKRGKENLERSPGNSSNSPILDSKMQKLLFSESKSNSPTSIRSRDSGEGSINSSPARRKKMIKLDRHVQFTSPGNGSVSSHSDDSNASEAELELDSKASGLSSSRHGGKLGSIGSAKDSILTKNHDMAPVAIHYTTVKIELTMNHDGNIFSPLFVHQILDFEVEPEGGSHDGKQGNAIRASQTSTRDVESTNDEEDSEFSVPTVFRLPGDMYASYVHDFDSEIAGGAEIVLRVKYDGLWNPSVSNAKLESEHQTLEMVEIGEKITKQVQDSKIIPSVGRDMRDSEIAKLLIQEARTVDKDNGKLHLARLDLAQHLNSKKKHSLIIALLNRLQAMCYWFVETASFIDYDDPDFFYFVLFESTSKSSLEIVGFTLVYKFNNQSRGIIYRICQQLTFPKFQRRGYGNILMNAVYSEAKEKDISEVNAEDPCQMFNALRDKVELSILLNDPEFNKFSSGVLQKWKKTISKGEVFDLAKDIVLKEEKKIKFSRLSKIPPKRVQYFYEVGLLRLLHELMESGPENIDLGIKLSHVYDVGLQLRIKAENFPKDNEDKDTGGVTYFGDDKDDNEDDESESSLDDAQVQLLHKAKHIEMENKEAMTIALFRNMFFQIKVHHLNLVDRNPVKSTS